MEDVLVFLFIVIVLLFVFLIQVVPTLQAIKKVGKKRTKK